MPKHRAPRPFAERPRPIRSANHPVARELRNWLDKPVRQGLVDGCTLGDIMVRLLAMPQYQRSIGGTIEFEGGPHGVLFMLAEAAYQIHPDSTVFEVDCGLAQRLNSTEFSAEHPIPAEYCRLPVDAPIYLHVPNAPDELAVASDHDTLPLCGYYLRETNAGGRRVLEIAAVSQPGKGDVSCEQDNFLFIDLPVDDSTASLLTLFQNANRRACENLGITERPELRARVLPHLDFVMKVLVYLNLSEARRVPHRDRSLAMADAARLGPRKRDAAQRRATHLYDFVRVCSSPEGDVGDVHNGTSTATRAAHYRRGHFRLARVGEGRLDRKLVWIRPTAVGVPGHTRRTYRVA